MAPKELNGYFRKNLKIHCLPLNGVLYIQEPWGREGGLGSYALPKFCRQKRKSKLTVQLFSVSFKIMQTELT